MARLSTPFRLGWALAGCAALSGQDLPRLQGTVLDASGAAVAGASVALTGLNRTFQHRTQTDRLGTFVFSVPPGPYQVKIDDRRFEPVQKDVVLSFAEPFLSLRFELTVRQTRQEITVEERLEQNSRYEVSQDTAALKTNESLLLTPQSVQVCRTLCSRIRTH